MVAIDPESRPRKGIFVSRRTLTIATVACLTLIFLETKSLLSRVSDRQLTPPAIEFHAPVLRNPQHLEQCRFYMASSAIEAEHSGLGYFAGVPLLPGDMVGFPDICIFVGDAPKKWTHLRSHTFGWSSFFGQYEGSNSRAACEGFATTFNTMPNTHVNTQLESPVAQTNAGLDRATSPGAGAITHHYGMHARALDNIPAGYEFTIDYGDWDFDEKKEYVKPRHPVQYLQENGWCVDYLEIRQSNDPSMGRGAFAKRRLEKGQIIAPAPLQAFQDRAVFSRVEPEQLYVNYCIQPRDSKMIFFPYGPAVGLINHSRTPNVALQWSKNSMHQATWLEMSYKDFWKTAWPGGLILEVVALREIAPGEELFMDYGEEWEQAWKEHVAQWQPLDSAEDYVYPEEMDETDVLRTVEEQKTDPYPDNLITMCRTPDWEREESNHVIWQEDNYPFWGEMMAFCHILAREKGKDGDPVYTVSLNFHKTKGKKSDLAYNESIPLEDQYIDFKVPRRAIRWIEKPYYDDEHMSNVFRHPIMFPDHLVPDAWRTELHVSQS